MTENYYDKVHQIIHYMVLYGVLHPFYYLRYKTKIIGRENIPKPPYLIVSNHYSYYDPTIISLASLSPVAYIAKKELFEEKSLLSKIITFLGAIPINREKPAPSTLKIIKKVVSAKWPIGIFIEGTRNQSRETLTKLETGAAFIAKFAGGLPVLPLGIRGGNKPFGSLEVHIGEVIPFDKNLSLEELTLKYGQSISKLADLELKLS